MPQLLTYITKSCKLGESEKCKMQSAKRKMLERKNAPDCKVANRQITVASHQLSVYKNLAKAIPLFFVEKRRGDHRRWWVVQL